jgi:hypothetical protein
MSEGPDPSDRARGSGARDGTRSSLALLDDLRRHRPSERLQKVLDEVEAEVRSAVIQSRPTPR